MEKLVTEVIESNYQILKSEPPQITINAKGEVPTTGWTNGKLNQYLTFVEPTDGIMSFGFTATKPTGTVAQHISIIEASVTVEMPKWMKGYRIYTATKPYEVIFKL